ncbi:MAG TPA: glycosyltransferase family 39 protein [Leptolyngbyaceae cyanobacterium]
MIIQPNSLLKSHLLTVVTPIFAFWTVLFFLGYPLPGIDDIFFTGSAINLAQGGEFTNPYLEAWNSALSSGKYYFQPPFHSYTLAAWLKIAGVSTTSLRLFQYLCYNLFSLSCALLLRFYGFPRITALCTTVFFAVWQCNPNFFYSPGFRQDALGMAYLAFGLWLLTKDNWWRYFLGFTFLESAVFTSPITSAYGFSFGISILTINFIYRNKNKSNAQYLTTIYLALLASTGLVFTIFLVCINFELQTFLSDFLLTASWRQTATFKGFYLFITIISRSYGIILNLPTYVLFLFLSFLLFLKRKSIPLHIKFLFFGLTLGIILNIFLYAFAIGFNFFFCWLGIVTIISKFGWHKNIKTIISAIAILVFLSSQSLNIIFLIGKEYEPESSYQKIREFVIANPYKKYAIDETAARFVFDYRLPKNSTSWTFMQPPIGVAPISLEDKPPDITWIVSKFRLEERFPKMLIDCPKIEFFGRIFNSLPKNPFDITIIP